MAKKQPTFAELEAEYEAARKTRKKDPARWNAAKHAYREAEHAIDHPDTGGVRVPVQPADVGVVSNN